MTKTTIFIMTILLTLTIACNNEKHFISDKSYRSKVEKDFQEKKAVLPNGDLFAIFNKHLSDKEREALTFLYAYMPIGDITDYSGQFYLNNVRSSFQAQKEMPWGDSIPEEMFRHFVLPVRVNNETLDNCRMVFYKELRNRVKDLSLYDAALEVNHWCHEKVVYTPSDSRTSSPLATVKTAFGRCGEESTFTVAALRSVGIPARQVYTPRWAHTDDNHAWVEAWVNGKWYFLGACEPAPVLNLGWFNGPAYRGMLMHTKVFGKYKGSEEIMDTTKCYTEINVINNYAPTAKAIINVVSKEGKPVQGAKVEFKIYNYAEFYTVAHKTTDTKGQTFLTAGKGDMLVWASKDGRFGYGKLSFGKMMSLNIALDKQPGDTASINLDIIPPVEGSIAVNTTREQDAMNTKRLHDEDSIRNKYVSSFYTAERARMLAKNLSIDSTATINCMIGSYGNWAETEKFLCKTPADKRSVALDLLNVISAKDLRDTPASFLVDHLNHTPEMKSPYFKEAILNPRIANEILTPYRSFFQANIDTVLAARARKNPEVLADWIKKNITITEDLNPQNIPMTPIGVWKARVADSNSRNIFFVAVARSLGIPAQIEPVAGKVQYAKDAHWININFEAETSAIVKQGAIAATYQPMKQLPDPKYLSHFSIANILEDATLQTLHLESNANIDMGASDDWSTLFKDPLPVDEGHYLLITGTRLASGSVLAKMTFFNVKADKTTNIQLVMRENPNEIKVIGNFNSENKFKLANKGTETSILLTTGRGYFIVGILGSRQEPTNHAMRDISAVKKDIEAWGRNMVLLFPSEKDYKNFDSKEFGLLPNNITYGIDSNNVIQKEITTSMHLKNANILPIFIIADTFNRVVYVSQGYTIGLGEQLMKVIHKISN